MVRSDTSTQQAFGSFWRQLQRALRNYSGDGPTVWKRLHPGSALNFSLVLQKVQHLLYSHAHSSSSHGGLCQLFTSLTPAQHHRGTWFKTSQDLLLLKQRTGLDFWFYQCLHVLLMQAQVWEPPWFWGSPELTHWKRNPQSNCVKRQGICEILRHEGLCCHSRTEVPIEGEKDRQTPFLTTESTLDISTSRTLRKQISVVYKLTETEHRLRAGLAKKWPEFKCRLTCYFPKFHFLS